MAATLVQSSGARSGNGTTEQWTWAVAPTVGNVIIVKSVGWANPTGPTTSCADTATNSYTQRTNALSTGSSATTTRGAIFDCVVAASPTSTTITWNIATDHSVVFEEWSGLDTSSLSDQVATPALSGLISGSGGKSLTVGPTGTLAQADELVQTLLGAATGTASSNIATPSGYTGGVFEQNSPSFIGMGSAYKTVAATDAVDATWTFDTAGTSGQTAVALLATYRIETPAPVLSSPTGSATGSQTATVGATTDEGNGTMYAVVTTSSTQPSVAQIKAGQDHTGASAAWAGSQAVSSTGAKTLDATGLAPNTAYYAHLVHTDAAANDSNRVSSAAFTTFQRAAPTSDVAAGAWTPSSGTDLFAAIDETTPSDADYIKTGTAADVCTVALGTLSDPAVSTGHKVSYRIGGDGTSGIQVALMQGTTVIASWTHDPAPASATTYTQTLTGTEADSITDYTALRLRFTEV